MLFLDHAFQKLTVHIVMPIYCIICLNITKIIPWHQEVYGIVIVIKLMMLMIMLQTVNHLNIKQILWEKFPRREERPPLSQQNPYGTQPPRSPQPTVLVLNVEFTIPLKYLSNFWRFLNLSLINCEIELNLSWTKDCGMIEHHNAKLYVFL